MSVKMYKGDDECLANSEQISVMENAGWSRTKDVKKQSIKEEQVKESEETPKTTKMTAPKKTTVKKRRVVKSTE